MQKNYFILNKPYLVKINIAFFISICFCYIAFPLTSGHITRSDVADCYVQQEDEYCFAGEPCNFVLRIPHIPPVLVQTTVQELPDGVTFLSSVKTEYYIDGDKSTEIHFQFIFNRTGNLEMPHIPARVDTFSYNFPFNAISVKENPLRVKPVLSVTLQNSKGEVIIDTNSFENKKMHIVPEIIQAGSPLKLTVWFSFATSIANITWTIPENSVFTEISRFDETLPPLGYSDGRLEAVVFNWIPLVSGTFTIPALSCTALSYSGSQEEITAPAFSIKAALSPSDNSGSVSKNSGFDSAISEGLADKETSLYYPEAFAMVDTQENAEMSVDDINEIVKKIGDFRILERNSLFPWKYITSRKKAEAELGLFETEYEISEKYVPFVLTVAIINLALALVFFLLKRKKQAVFFSTFTTIFLVILVWLFISLSPSYGVFIGGQLKTVPESSSSFSTVLAPGTRVKVLAQRGSWMYISSDNEKSGWIDESSVILIK